MEVATKYPFVVCQDGVKAADDCPVFEGKIVYEVIRIIDGKPLFFKEHMKRLAASVALTAQGEIQLEALEAGLKQLILVNQMSSDNARIELSFLNKSEALWSIQAVKGVYPSPETFAQGVEVRILDAQRQDPHAKVVNQSLVSQVAEIRAQTGVFEVLLRDQRGYMTEGSRSNFFIMSNGTLIGVPEALILKGITRDKIIESAALAGIPYDEALLSADDLYHADAIMLSGTSIDLLPVSRIDTRLVNSSAHPLFEKLLAQYRELMKSSLNSF